jgi:hypothetical protein
MDQLGGRPFQIEHLLFTISLARIMRKAESLDLIQHAHHLRVEIQAHDFAVILALGSNEIEDSR